MEDFIKVLKSLSVDEADKADLEDAIAKLEGKMIVTFVNEFNVLKPEEAKPNDDGTYEVKLMFRVLQTLWKVFSFGSTAKTAQRSL